MDLKNRPHKQQALLICVVLRADGSASRRPHGDFASFIGFDQEELVERAHRAMEEWSYGKNTYKLVVGVLTHEVQFPTAYKLKAL